MKKLLLSAIIMAIIWPQGIDAQFGGILKKAKEVVSGESSLTQDEAGLGLKEALNIGVQSAVDQLSEEKGYLDSPYKILLPEEAQKVVSKLKVVPGFDNIERDLVLKMNEAAELSAKKATPIFVDAIKEITFEDALNILKGEDDAATRYLEQKSREKLYTAFLPVIQDALDEVGARVIWNKAVTAYNQIPFVSKTNPELDDHVNDKALDGLFGLIEVKEGGIRNNVDQRTSDLLKKVFQ